MACGNVGNSNPDIAGLGIILSFVIQAGISFFLSLWSAVLDVELGKPVLRTILPQWAQNLPVLRPYKSHQKLDDSDIEACSTVDNISDSGLLPLRLRKWHIDQMLAIVSDVQILNGISLLIGAMAQHKTLDLYHYHIIYDVVNFTGISVCASLVNVFGNRRPSIVDRCVLMGLFVILYMAFVIVFGMNLKQWDENTPGRCYYTHAIAAPSSSHPYVDTIYVAITCLYFLGSIGMCSLVAIFTLHPKIDQVDHIFFELFGVAQDNAKVALYGSSKLTITKKVVKSLKGRISSKLGDNHNAILIFFQKFDALSVLKTGYKTSVLIIAMMQYPVHVYTVFALRIANEERLDGDSENDWGFGQVVALALLISSVLQCIRTVIDYRKRLSDIKRKAGITFNGIESGHSECGLSQGSTHSLLSHGMCRRNSV